MGPNGQGRATVAAQRSTKVQVQAYRFGVRRVEHAVQSGVAYRQSLHGPRHGLAMVIGLVVSGLVLAGFAVYGFIKPAPSIRDAKVLVDTDSGSAYVIRDGVAYPALNLASAMLAADQDSTGANSVRQVNTATLADLPRGQLLGIPGAPHQVPAEASLARNTWTVCDVITRDPAAAPGMTVLPKTTVTIGLTATRPATDATTVLATPDGRSYFLIFQGRRARVEDPTNAVLTEGLGLDLAAARRISVGLLNAIPEVAPLRIPTIPSMGAATKVGGRTMRVGDVVTVERASGGTVHVVVFADGAQEVTPAVADLVRVASGQTAAPVAISPSELASLGPTASPLDVAAYPAQRPQVTTLDRAPALCLDWQIVDGSAVRRVYAASDVPVPTGAVPVPAPPTVGSVPVGTGAADAVYLPPGQGLVIGQASDGVTANTGNLFLVTDQGIKFPVVSLSALQALGLGKTIAPAPAELVGLLPLGPTLDRAPARRFFGEAPHANG